MAHPYNFGCNIVYTGCYLSFDHKLPGVHMSFFDLHRNFDELPSKHLIRKLCYCSLRGKSQTGD